VGRVVGKKEPITGLPKKTLGGVQGGRGGRMRRSMG